MNVPRSHLAFPPNRANEGTEKKRTAITKEQ